MVKETDALRAVQPPLEPRRGSTVEMVDRIKAMICNPAVKIEPKEPPRGR